MQGVLVRNTINLLPQFFYFTHSCPLTPFSLNSSDAPEVRALTSGRSRSAQIMCFWNIQIQIYLLNGLNSLQSPWIEGFWNARRVRASNKIQSGTS